VLSKKKRKQEKKKEFYNEEGRDSRLGRPPGIRKYSPEQNTGALKEDKLSELLQGEGDGQYKRGETSNTKTDV